METIFYVIIAFVMLFALAVAISYCMGKKTLAFIFKMIASSVLVFAVALTVFEREQSNVYTGLVIIAVMTSFWGDYFLAKKEFASDGKKDLIFFASGVSSFSVAQIMLIIAFWLVVGELKWYFLPLVLVTVIPTLVGKFTKMLDFKSDKYFYLTLFYGILLSFAMLTAVNRYYVMRTKGSLIAMIGSLFFVVSDLSLGFYYFSNMKKKMLFNYPIMIFYFLAELFYIVSVVFV